MRLTARRSPGSIRAPKLIAIALLYLAIGIAFGFDLGLTIIGPPAHAGARCDHGESSIRAWRDREGRWHQSKPFVTGCAPH